MVKIFIAILHDTYFRYFTSPFFFGINIIIFSSSVTTALQLHDYKLPTTGERYCQTLDMFIKKVVSVTSTCLKNLSNSISTRYVVETRVIIGTREISFVFLHIFF